MQIARGQESAQETPYLYVSISIGGVPINPAALSYAIFNTSTAELKLEPEQVFPVADFQDVDLDDDKIADGRFALLWEVPVDAALGSYQIRVRATFAAGADPVEWAIPFEVVDAFAVAPVHIPGYTTIARVRDEGVTSTMASDERLADLIEEASFEIDKTCGWWFNPRVKTLVLSGHGRKTLALPAPPIEILEVSIDGKAVTSWHMIGRCPLGVESPRKPIPGIERGVGSSDRILDFARHELVWPKGRENIVIRGVFGYTEDNGTQYGRTPFAIRRACEMMVTRMSWQLDSAESEDAINRGRTKRVKTSQQEVEYFPSGGGAAGGNAPATAFDSNPEISRILAAYMRPPDLGLA